MSSDTPVSADDVAAYVISKTGRITAMKLQKLLYYAQAWALVWDEAPLFAETIEAWANGPVAPHIYERHRGLFDVTDWPAGDPSKLSPDQQETIDAVLGFYGHKSAQWLSDLTHEE